MIFPLQSMARNQKVWIVSLALAATLCVLPMLPAQEDAPRPPRRIHLILKDGSYQVVTSYTVSGRIVRYVSAERGGAQEEIPTALVDLDATARWEKQHTLVPPGGTGSGRAPALDPELLKEEQDRAALTPEVAPDLRLPQEDSILVLDEFQGAPDLVPLVQSEGELNHTTSHSILRKAINPRAAGHEVVTLRGVKSYVQLHVNEPAFYVRVGDETQLPTGGTPLVVNTHGASSASINNEKPSADSRYIIVQADVRVDARIVGSFNAALLGTRQSEDVIETRAEDLPGGHWKKLLPARPLDIGEYVLMEVLSNNEINLGIWDFGVHPAAPENRDVVKPQPRRRVDLERRRPD